MISTIKIAGAAALAFTLGGSGVRASEGAYDGMERMKRHAAAMIPGLPHDEARKATTRVSAEEAAPLEVQRRHAAAMLTGLPHDEARKASAADLTTPGELERANARARRLAEGLWSAKTYDEARRSAGDL